jgi:hypothetical protein
MFLILPKELINYILSYDDAILLLRILCKKYYNHLDCFELKNRILKCYHLYKSKLDKATRFIEDNIHLSYCIKDKDMRLNVRMYKKEIDDIVTFFIKEKAYVHIDFGEYTVFYINSKGEFIVQKFGDSRVKLIYATDDPYTNSKKHFLEIQPCDSYSSYRICVQYEQALALRKAFRIADKKMLDEFN